jgi:hypothetical protein
MAFVAHHAAPDVDNLYCLVGTFQSLQCFHEQVINQPVPGRYTKALVCTLQCHQLLPVHTAAAAAAAATVVTATARA